MTDTTGRGKRIARRLAAIVAACAVATYAAAAGAIYSQQRSLLFRPDPARIAPASAGLPQAREIGLNRPGEPLLIGWHVPPAAADGPVYLYLHGNGGNLARRSGRFSTLTRDGAGLLAVSFRGYGGSEGEPSEAGFRQDAARAFDFLARQGIGVDRIVLYGESLGSGVAVMEAAERRVRGLVLDSPYESIAAIASERYWWLPVDLLIRDPFRAIAAAPRVTAPALAMACTQDWLTPYDGAQRLVSQLGGPRRLITFDRRCHIPGVTGAADAIAAFTASLER